MSENTTEHRPISPINQELHEAVNDVSALGPLVIEAVFANEPIDTELYLADDLRVEVAVSKDELVRPIYTVAGRRVAFRNRQEIVDYEGETITMLGDKTEPPLDMNDFFEESPAKEKSKRRAKCDATKNFNARHSTSTDTPENILIIPNTVSGLLEAAVMLGRSDLQGLRGEVVAGRYDNPALTEITDSIIGAIEIDDNGRRRERKDTSGLAIVLAALTGDAEAERIVSFKKQAVRSLEEQRVRDIASDRVSHQQKLETEKEDLPLSHMALVHVTGHGAHINSAGEVEIFPTGQYDELVGRSTVHFTVNSVVCPRGGVVDALSAWAADNTIIIGSLPDIMAATGKKPDSLNGVDTWFSLSPGEPVRIPGATIIEPTRDGEDVISVSDNHIKILIKDSYSDAEEERVSELAKQYNGYSPTGDTKMTLQATAVQMALSRRGITPDERCAPSTDGHGMADPALDGRISAVARTLGVRSEQHFSGPEYNVEREGWTTLGDIIDERDPFDANYVHTGYAPLSAVRWMALRGAFWVSTEKYEEETDEYSFR